MHPSLEVPLIVLANIVSVVGVVSVNKLVYQAGFNFPTSLMCMHFICTWAFIASAQRMNVFQEKRIPTMQYVFLGAAQVGSVAFVNLSLLHNTIGAYQLFKFTNVFVTCLMEYFWKSKVYSAPIYASLTLLVFGVCVATLTQVSFSAAGVVYGLLGSVATAGYQILNKQVQTEHNVSAFQLLQFEQPFTALFAGIFAFATDDIGRLAAFQPSSQLVGLILVTCVFAFGVNLTCYLIIGKTSPLTYSVVGHTKTVSLLVIGFVAFGEETTMKNFIGLCTAFGGIVWYTHLTSTAAKPAPTPKKSEEGEGAEGSPMIQSPGAITDNGESKRDPKP